MALFTVVEILYLAQIACHFAQIISVLIIVFFGSNQLGGVDFDRQNRVFIALLILLLLFTTVFFKFFFLGVFY